MLSLVIALLLIIIFFSLESYLRYGTEAKSFKLTPNDKNSTSYLGRAFALNIIFLLSGFLFQHFHVFLIFKEPTLAYYADLLVLIGLFLRIKATRSLKEYYTRTLKVQTNQKLIDFGIYRYIRHPGYAGVILIWIGAGFSSNNYLVTILVSLVTFAVYHYRMNSEEEMLIDRFGEAYNNYIKKTWRLLPLIY